MDDLKKENMKKLVWSELCHSTYWEQYLSQYCNHKQNINSKYSITIIICSSFGLTFSCVWKIAGQDKKITMWVSVVVFILILASEIISICKKFVTIDTETERKIRELRIKYLDYLNLIEKLWIDIISTNITGDIIEERYFELRKKCLPIEDLKDSLNIKKLKNPNKRGMKEAHTRLSRKFGAEINNN